MALEAGQGALHPADFNKMIVKNHSQVHRYLPVLFDQTYIPLTYMSTP